MKEINKPKKFLTNIEKNNYIWFFKTYRKCLKFIILKYIEILVFYKNWHTVYTLNFKIRQNVNFDNFFNNILCF